MMGKTQLKNLSWKIKECLMLVKEKEGWSIDDLADYLEVNTATLRNCLSRLHWGDQMVTILKLKCAIPVELSNEYKLALESAKHERRKIKMKESK